MQPLTQPITASLHLYAITPSARPQPMLASARAHHLHGMAPSAHPCLSNYIAHPTHHMAPSVEVCNALYLFSLLLTRMYTNMIVYETGTIGRITNGWIVACHRFRQFWTYTELLRSRSLAVDLMKGYCGIGYQTMSTGLVGECLDLM